MKTQVLRSIVCALPIAVLVVVSSGKVVNGQDKKQDKKQVKRTITIIDGDTTINGKALSEMSRAEKEKARKEFREMERERKSFRMDRDGDREITIIRKRGDAPAVIKWRTDSGSNHRYFLGDKNARFFTFRNDSVYVSVDPDSIMRRFHIDSLNKFHGRIAFPRDFSIPMPNAVRVPRPRLFVDGSERPEGWGGRERTNTQSFSFRNTDKDGITTRINISVSDASKEQIKKITGKEAASTLTIHDLTMATSFSSGKVAIMFTLPSKGTASVKLLDNELKPVFSENLTQSSFSKQVMMPRNGVYYLVVSQGNKYAVKRIVKQQ